MSSRPKIVNTWISPSGAIHMDKSTTEEIKMTTASKPNRRNTDVPPDFTETDLADLHTPNLNIRTMHRTARKFQHTMRRQTFKHYLSAIAFIRENDIIDPEVTRIAVNCGEWEVVWPDIGGIV